MLIRIADVVHQFVSDALKAINLWTKVQKIVDMGEASTEGANRAIDKLGATIVNELIKYNGDALKGKTSQERIQMWADKLKECKEEGLGDPTHPDTMLDAFRMVINDSEYYRDVYLTIFQKILQEAVKGAIIEAITP
jgi:hypothetical protein